MDPGLVESSLLCVRCSSGVLDVCLQGCREGIGPTAAPRTIEASEHSCATWLLRVHRASDSWSVVSLTRGRMLVAASCAVMAMILMVLMVMVMVVMMRQRKQDSCFRCSASPLRLHWHQHDHGVVGWRRFAVLLLGVRRSKPWT